ncbi:4'-phosphopantetheinyl transferase superfamily protein [Lipingzhangella sp. LS1_29]|uniref:4'-phosphopantetheinyl transferase superfamily protein n=1 Tax=Lipingzhangella rawalii TaxID=2055835 RepID=A0ABU2HAX1_9ACTN|nr:4'-phosphopantetheinyl transferase superfamily protein [Lipingzhangella rawalii]MDS1272457.1 4'-phosphopantetheinyl transferase superfamily protein [Lipingzhangella rawalii]
MIEQLVPRAAVGAEAVDDGDSAGLFPEELPFVAGRSPRRHRQFATVRDCARRALETLGVPPGPILPGHCGAPRWPAGIVGSMTHCAGYCGAVVGRTTDLAMVGLDAEPAAALPKGVLSMVASPGEQEHQNALHETQPFPYWDRLLFSAKEAAYKAWFPRSRRWSALRDVAVCLHPSGIFTASVPRVVGDTGAAADHMLLAGRWLVSGDLLCTLATEATEDTVVDEALAGVLSG